MRSKKIKLEDDFFDYKIETLALSPLSMILINIEVRTKKLKTTSIKPILQK